MSVTTADLVIYHSAYNGIAGTNTPVGGMGGAIDAAVDQVNLANNIFPQISATEASSGLTDYRCIYIKNNNATHDLTDSKFFLEVPPISAGITIQLGLGTAVAGEAEQEIDDRFEEPTGITWLPAPNAANGLVLPTLTPGLSKSIWLKRIVSAGTVQAGTNSFILSCVGETL